MPTLPTNPHYIGDSGHVNDHNTIVTALSDTVYKSPTTDQIITAQSATVTPLVVKGAASQTDKLLEAQTSAGTVVASIANDGQIYGGGGAFPVPFRVAVGTFSTYGGVPTTVTFPASRFSQAPIVLASIEDQTGFVKVNTVTTSSVKIYCLNSTGGALGAQGWWHAIQMTSSSASG